MNALSRFLRPRILLGALVGVLALVAGAFAAPLLLGGPTVVSVVPADGEAAFNPRAPVRIGFSQPVRPESVRQAVVFEPSVPFTVTMDGPNAAVLHTADLQYGAQYRLTIGPAVQNILGRAMAAERTLAFATAPYITVASFAPADGLTDVALDAPLTIEFARPVVAADLVAAAADDPRRVAELPQPFTLQTADGEAVEGVGRWLSPTLFGFYPAHPLAAATSYVATLQAELTPDGAVRMEQPLAWRFTTAAPLLEGTRPFDGEEEVPAAEPVEVRLHRDVDITSAAAAFELVAVDSGGAVAGSVEPFDGGFRFRPASPLRRGARYEARLDAGIRTRAGRNLGNQTLSWQFQTIGDPLVLQVEPLPDATDVPTTTNRISVRFDHPIVAVKDVAGQGNQPAPLQIDPPLQAQGLWLDTSTFVLSPTAGLEPSTSYTVRVPAGLADQTGGTLAQEYVWTFTTIQPLVLETMPATAYAAPTDTVKVVFNQPMNPDGVRAAFALLRRDNGTRVDGTLDVQDHIASFTPAAPLERGAEYDVTVAEGVPSANGRGTLQGRTTITFRVAPLPALTGSEPAAGTQGADPGGSVTLNFSTPMDWASVERNLQIVPKPTEVYTSTNENQLFLYFPLQPETDYAITVGAAARDPYGVTLGQDATIGFRTAPLPPSLATVGAYRSGAYNANVPVRVPFQHVNVPELRYRLFRVSPEQGALLISDYEAWRTFQPEAGMLVTEQRVPLQGQRNIGRIDVADLGRLDAGLYYIELQGAGSSGPLPDVADRQIMAVSPYALTVKRSPERVFVWAVDLASGQPVPDLPLVAGWYDYETSALERPVQLGRTDADGVLDAEYTVARPYAPVYLWTADGGPLAFATTDWSGGISPYDFGLPGDPARTRIAGNLATDRPIYRPGQSVQIRGVLRRSDDGRFALPPGGSRAHLSVSDTEGNTVLSTTLALSDFGTFDTTLPLVPGAPLGGYSMSAAIVPSTGAPFDPATPAIFGQFAVAEYRKPAFEVTVAPAAPDLVQGEQIVFDVRAAYFSGGAPANAPVRWRLLSAPRFFSPESAPTYSFGRFDDADLWYRSDGRPPQTDFGELIAEGSAAADAQGRFRLALGPDQYTLANAASASRRLTLDVEITDIDGQVIAGQGAVNLHPAAFYVGVRPDNYVARAGQPTPVSLITVTPQGDPAPNRELSVEIFRREWYSAREQAADGRLYWTSKYSDTLVQSLDARSDSQGRASVSVTLPEGGEYRIGASGKDDQGRTAASDGFVWATGGDVFWGVDDTSRVDLIADKRQYAPGDTAQVLVTAPYKGMTALVTIERGTVLEHRLLTLAGTTEVVAVPIDPGYAPNVYVGVTLIAPAGDGTTPDRPAVPEMRVGLVNLPVSTERQELTLTVTPDRAAAGPRDTVRYTVKASDYSGKGVRAEVALALVDKAVLTLADDPNPTLRQSFYERRPLNVFTSSPLTVLVDRVTVKLQPGDKGGGGAAEGASFVRQEFPDTAFWEPALVTGDDGTATFSVTLPDTLTTWRLSARAVTADTLVGQAQSDVVASKPLYLRPTLPRFLTAGDSATLQAVVHNSTNDAIDADASLLLGDASALTVEEPAGQRVNVAAGGTALVRWNVAVPAGVATDSVTLTLRVAGAGVEDTLATRLPLKRLETLETTASAGQVIDQVVETVRLPAGKSGDGRLDLELVPSLTAGALDGVRALAAHPYDGAEQSVSKFLPAAALQRALAAAGVQQPELAATLQNELPRSLQRLYAMQQLDGGWGWWESDASDLWITAYVVHGLVEARRAGYDVDQAVFERALDFLETAMDEECKVQSAKIAAQAAGNFAFCTLHSYGLFVLAEAGRLDRSRVVTLFDQRDQLGLGVEGRAYLLLTLAAAQTAAPVPADTARITTLISELMGRATLTTSEAQWQDTADAPWFASNTHVTALATLALLRADPDNVLVPNAVRFLMARQDHGAWHSTYEGAFATLALAEYIGASGDAEASYTYRATLDGAALHEAAVARDTLGETARLSVPAAQLKPDGSQLVLQRQAASGQSGRGRLYYTLRLRSYEPAGTAQALDHGVAVAREYVAVASGTLTPTGQLVQTVRVGDVVQVRLTLRVPQAMRYLTVEDFLPAGLEALDSSLKTVSAAAGDPSLEESAAEVPYYWFWSRTEARDDRVALFAAELPQGTYTYTFLARAVTPGVFAAAPATARQTYAPEVFGRSAGNVFTVTTP
jgi:alpha-2-macroglobulin